MKTEVAQAAVVLLLLAVFGASAIVHPESGRILIVPGGSEEGPEGNTPAVTHSSAPEANSTLAPGRILIVYNPECPHCHELLAYIQKYYPNAPITKTTNGSVAQEPLQAAGVQWDGGVPLMIVRLPDGNYIVLEGFPAAQQNVNGYVYGQKSEEAMCKQLKGTSVDINGQYAFCKLPNGTIIGNEHAVDWVMEKLGIQKAA